MKKLHGGINPVLVTPLKENGELDVEALRQLAGRMIESGVHGVVVLGSMGELPYLAQAERRAAVEAVAEEAGGRVQVIAGATAFGAMEAARNAADAVRDGADALLVPLPVYFAPNFSEVCEYYRRVCGAVDIPVIYYHIPSVTHLDLDAAEIAEIFEIDGVKGIKDSIMDLPVILEHIDLLPRDAVVFSGSTFLLKSVIEHGGHGAICPVPLIMPGTAVNLYDACVNGDAGAALKYENELLKLVPLFLDMETDPETLGRLALECVKNGVRLDWVSSPHARVKEMLRLMGDMIIPRVKAPLPPLCEADAARVKEVATAAGLI